MTCNLFSVLILTEPSRGLNRVESRGRGRRTKLHQEDPAHNLMTRPSPTVTSPSCLSPSWLSLTTLPLTFLLVIPRKWLHSCDQQNFAFHDWGLNLQNKPTEKLCSQFPPRHIPIAKTLCGKLWVEMGDMSEKCRAPARGGILFFGWFLGLKP